MMLIPSQYPLIVSNPLYLNVDWAQQIIKHQNNDSSQETVVKNVEVLSVDVGTTTRVRLKVDHNNTTNLPSRWFVKLPSLSFRARLITTLPRLLSNEIRFYKELAHVIPLKKPHVLAAYSQFGKGSTLVINDLTEINAKPGITGEVVTIAQARSVVQHLARCHAHFIHKIDRTPEYHWLANPIRRLEDRLGTILAVPLMKRGLHRANELIPHSLHKAAINYARHRKEMMQFLSAGTPTLVHHDCHAGNLYWQNDEPGFLDWQMVRLGEAIGDISYFLGTSLEPEDRRQHEMTLLAEYHQQLTDNSTYKIDFNQLLQRYRVHLSYPFESMVMTLAVGDLMPLASNLAMLQRTTVAVQDHESFRYLPKMS